MKEITNKKDIVVNVKNDIANLFNLSYDEANNRYTYNLNKSIYIQSFDTYAASLYTVYEVKDRDTWLLISYNVYGTTELWWLVCKTNQIYSPISESPNSGDNLKILSDEIVQTILTQIRNQ